MFGFTRHHASWDRNLILLYDRQSCLHWRIFCVYISALGSARRGVQLQNANIDYAGNISRRVGRLVAAREISTRGPCSPTRMSSEAGEAEYSKVKRLNPQLWDLLYSKSAGQYIKAAAPHEYSK